MKKQKQKLPAGWDEEKVKRVIAHYENQTDEEAVAEIEAALEAENSTMMAIPTEMVPKVQELIAKSRSRGKKRLKTARP